MMGPERQKSILSVSHDPSELQTACESSVFSHRKITKQTTVDLKACALFPLTFLFCRNMGIIQYHLTDLVWLPESFKDECTVVQLELFHMRNSNPSLDMVNHPGPVTLQWTVWNIKRCIYLKHVGPENHVHTRQWHSSKINTWQNLTTFKWVSVSLSQCASKKHQHWVMFSHTVRRVRCEASHCWLTLVSLDV